MGHKLKYTKYDDNGNRIIERSRNWYLAETPDGRMVKIPSGVKNRNANVSPVSMQNLRTPKARTMGSISDQKIHTVVTSVSANI